MMCFCGECLCCARKFCAAEIPLHTCEEVQKRINERRIWVSRSNFETEDNGRNSSLKEFPTARDDLNFFLNNSMLCGDGVLT
jgi:hypothetical protein